MDKSDHIIVKMKRNTAEENFKSQMKEELQIQGNPDHSLSNVL